MMWKECKNCKRQPLGNKPYGSEWIYCNHRKQEFHCSFLECFIEEKRLNPKEELEDEIYNLDDIVRMYKEHYSVMQIAKITHHSQITVREALKKLNIYKFAKKIDFDKYHQVIVDCAKSGMSYDEISDETNISVTTLRKYCKDNNIKVTGTKRYYLPHDEIIAKAKEGYKSGELAKMFNCSKMAIHTICNKAGVYERKPYHRVSN